MKKLLILFVSVVCIYPAKADEGMWLPVLLNNNYAEMQKLGLKLTPEQLYDVNHSSLKDAICWFNGGCTSEIISGQGLLLTNHHCGYEAIADHSTTADNILDNGFWARSFAEEKPNHGMWVSILVRMEDVSDKVNKTIEGLEGKDKETKQAEIFKSLIKDATQNTGYEGSVRSFFKDNAYYLFVYERFTDIRLVAAPPQSIGKFGGETDNWMWPRHNADFAMFRIYANKENKPAPYSKDNVPYKPKQFLNVSIKGVNQGDYTMIYGYPGRTNRYETSYGIDLATKKINPSIVDLREIRLNFWQEQMNKSDSTRLLLSSQYARISNYWKYFIGQTEQLKRLKVYDEKKATEQKFMEWAKNKPQYASILQNIERAYQDYNKYALHSTYMTEGIRGSSILAKAYAYFPLDQALSAEKPDVEATKKMLEIIKNSNEDFYKSFNVASEEKILAAMMQMFYRNIPADQYPAYLAEIMKKYKGKTEEETFQKLAQAVFKKSILASKDAAAKFLENPDVKKLQKDPAYALAKAFSSNYTNNIKSHIDDFKVINDAEGSKYVKALMEMEPNRNFYPDANSTMRVTYGTVKDYIPKDGVQYEYYTTLAGVMEKEDPHSFEFQVPSKLKELYQKKDYGMYADNKGELHTDFISNNDITGGNSGSPVINANGELVGLAFDGNWEAMSGDIYFDSKYKRTISVDIRYILFLVDKFGGAENLIKEMNIIRN